MNTIKKIVLFLCCAVSFGSFAQEDQSVPEMITDRPDATESPSTVPVGFLQVETGAFYESFEDNDLKTEVFGYNTTLLRFGILDNLELRLGWNFEETQFAINGNEINNVLSGFSPLLAGMKVAITEEKGLLPEMGLLGHLYLPFTAANDYRPETTGVDFRFSFAHTLSERSSLAYNLGAQWLDDSPEAAYVYTLVYGYSITDRFGLYAELYGDLPEDSSSNHLWDAGITYLIQPNIQLDATVGSSISEGQDILLSAGVSFRIPK
ncbi:MAG: transporter [Flavobacteriales bacterium]|nr:transporter [Flavobacteriales bacterium]